MYLYGLLGMMVHLGRSMVSKMFERLTFLSQMIIKDKSIKYENNHNLFIYIFTDSNILYKNVTNEMERYRNALANSTKMYQTMTDEMNNFTKNVELRSK